MLHTHTPSLLQRLHSYSDICNSIPKPFYSQKKKDIRVKIVGNEIPTRRVSRPRHLWFGRGGVWKQIKGRFMICITGLQSTFPTTTHRRSSSRKRSSGAWGSELLICITHHRRYSPCTRAFTRRRATALIMFASILDDYLFCRNHAQWSQASQIMTFVYMWMMCSQSFNIISCNKFSFNFCYGPFHTVLTFHYDGCS